MSRYKLKPAEILRKQLLRMSKNHDEAARQVRKKWCQMQENIAPYLPESQPDRITASPVFASRVPTGRLPEQERRPGSHRRVLSEPRSSPLRAEAAQTPSSELRAPQDRLDRALEAEISEFLQRKEVSPVSREKYRFLRRADAEASRSPWPPAKSASDLEPVSLFTGPQLLEKPSDADLDSELGEIEDQAGQLEAQLAWWSQQRQILSPMFAEPSSKEDSSGELVGCSEWLQLPPPEESSCRGSALLPGEHVMQLEGPKEQLKMEDASLPELIARQAAELVAAALQEADGSKEKEFGQEATVFEQPEAKVAQDTQPAEEAVDEQDEAEQRDVQDEISPRAPSQRSKAIAMAEQWALELAASREKVRPENHIDHLVTQAELQELLRGIGVEAQETLAEQVFEDLDRDSEQKISLAELSRAFLPRNEPEATSEQAICGQSCLDDSSQRRMQVSNFSELFNV